MPGPSWVPGPPWRPESWRPESWWPESWRPESWRPGSWLPGAWPPGSGPERVEIRLLTALTPGCDTVADLARALGVPEDEIGAALDWAVSTRLVVRDGGRRLRLTERGEGARDAAAASPAAAPTGPTGPTAPTGPSGPPPYDPRSLAAKVGELGAAARHGHDAAVERARAGQLADVAAREHAVEVVNHAYVRGAVDLTERERRVGLALAARTRGDLVEAVTGLGPPGVVLPPATTGRTLAAAARRDRAVVAAQELRRTLLAVAAAGAALSAVIVAIIVLVIVLGS